MEDWIWILVAVACLAVGVLAGVLIRKKVAEAKIGSASQEAARILDEGIKAAETKKKEALIEAKEEIMRSNKEFEREIKERRSEISRLERRCVSREEALDKKIEATERKEEILDKKIKENNELTGEIEKIKVLQLERLEQISGYTVEEAKQEIISQIEDEAKHSAALRLVEIEERLKEIADDLVTSPAFLKLALFFFNLKRKLKGN